ncbi:MAG: FmdB family zinc ribbon protein [Acidimicrobiia bacterium]
MSIQATKPMPTYEYVCKSCGENIEVFQSFNSRPLKKHAECGGELQKVFHARGVVFKGSGFYKTDSRTGSSSDKSESRSSNDRSESRSSNDRSESRSSKSENGKSGAKKKTTASKDSSGSSTKD